MKNTLKLTIAALIIFGVAGCSNYLEPNMFDTPLYNPDQPMHPVPTATPSPMPSPHNTSFLGLF